MSWIKISWPSKYGNNGWISNRKEEKSHVKNNLIAVLLMRFILKMTTHPRAERLGNSLVVGRQQVSRTSGNLNVRLNKGEVGFRTLGHEGLLCLEDQNLLNLHRCFTLTATSTFVMLTEKIRRRSAWLPRRFLSSGDGVSNSAFHMCVLCLLRLSRQGQWDLFW